MPTKKKTTKTVTKNVVAKKEEKVDFLATGAAPELHPEFDPDIPVRKQRHLIR